MRKVLFVDTTHPLLPQLLEQAHFEVEHFYSNSREELLSLLPGYEGIIIRSKFTIDKALLDAAPQLRFIGRVGAGMENIDTTLARQRGIQLFNAPEGNRDAVGEHSLGMLLALMNKLLRADAQVRRGIWKREENRGYEIQGKTVGIIGYGNMGTAFAQRLAGFGSQVLAYDKYKKHYGDRYAQEADMEALYRHADIISLHLPLTNETKYLINRQWIERFHKPFYLVNTSRGPIVNTADLVEALEEGKLRGACLDVLEYEKSSFETMISTGNNRHYRALMQSEKVILSPHVAGWTYESNRKLAEVIADKIIRNFSQ